MIGYVDQAMGINLQFYQQYRSIGGHNGRFEFPRAARMAGGRGGAVGRYVARSGPARFASAAGE